MAVNTRLSKANLYISTSEKEYISEVPYREVVRVSLWCSLICRPDLSYAVNLVAKLNIKPSIVH